MESNFLFSGGFLNVFGLLFLSVIFTVVIEAVRRKSFSAALNFKLWAVSIIVGFLGSAFLAGIIEGMSDEVIEFGSKWFYILFIGCSGLIYFGWTLWKGEK